MSKKYLILENGAVFSGESFGYAENAVGELVFSTGITGYPETLTDPCYCGQIVVQTFPLVGNYGIIPEDIEGAAVSVKAYIVREWCQEPSNFRCEGSLDAFLKSNKIPALSGVDTRALTRTIRECGVMNARISDTPDLTEDEWAELRAYRVARPTCEKAAPITLGCCGKSAAVINLGDIAGADKELIERGFKVTVFDALATAEEILAVNPSAIVITGGPADPKDYADVAEELKKLAAHKIPTFAFGLGHQVLALANGGDTEKLHYGHRGANQPVRDIARGCVYVTRQNHGYTVSLDKLPENAKLSHVNLNDGSCEGLEYTDTPAFSVQFDPNSNGGEIKKGMFYDKLAAYMDGGAE